MYEKNKSRKNNGIIALFPAIILSSILLILCVSASQSLLALLYRTNIFDEKMQSDVLVHACTLRVRAKIKQNLDYIGGNKILLIRDPDIFCEVGNLANESVDITVKIGNAVSKDYLEL